MYHPGPEEQLHSVIGANGALFDGQRLGGQLPHTGLHPVQQSLIQRKLTPSQDKEGAAEGVFHRNPIHVFLARHIVKRFQHQQNRAALIGLDTGLVLGCDHFQRTVPVQKLVKLTQLPIPVDQQDIAGIAVLEVCHDSPVGRPAGIGVRLAVYNNL